MKSKPLEFLRKLAPLFRRKLVMAGAAMVVLGLIIGLFAIFSDSKPVSVTSVTVASNNKYQVKGLSTHDQHNHSDDAATGEGESTTTGTTTAPKIPNTPQKKTEDTPKLPKPPTGTTTPTPTIPTPPTVADTHVTRVTVDILNGCAGTYKYTVYYEGGTAVTLSMRWEIVTSTDPNISISGQLPTAYPIGGGGPYAGPSYMFDTITPGLPLFTGRTYSARIHVTSPNDVYSNTVNIPETCQP